MSGVSFEDIVIRDLGSANAFDKSFLQMRWIITMHGVFQLHIKLVQLHSRLKT